MTHTVHGEASFALKTPEVDLFITERGGHMAPVVFHLTGRDVSPYALAPWRPDEFPAHPALLSVLRGDFFCLPFGGQAEGPPHGESANMPWREIHRHERGLHLEIATQDNPARIEKILTTKQGHHAIYCEHRISQLSGNFSYGNHPILDLSSLHHGQGRVSVSPFRWASVNPGWFSNPAHGESQALAPSAPFTHLTQVPLIAGGTTDLTRYPLRSGNDDLVMMVSVPPIPQQPFAWSAVVFDGYLWFSLKNPHDFPATLLWLSNGGRPAEPWNGRHLARLGVEEVCSYFANGLQDSRKDLLAAQAIPTTRLFKPHQTVSLKTVQAVSLLPDGFGKVSSITPADALSVIITGESGQQIQVPIDWNFCANPD